MRGVLHVRQHATQSGVNQHLLSELLTAWCERGYSATRYDEVLVHACHGPGAGPKDSLVVTLGPGLELLGRAKSGYTTASDVVHCGEHACEICNFQLWQASIAS